MHVVTVLYYTFLIHVVLNLGIFLMTFKTVVGPFKTFLFLFHFEIIDASPVSNSP